MNQSLHVGLQQRRDGIFGKPQTELQGQIFNALEQEAGLVQKHMLRTSFSGLTWTVSPYRHLNRQKMALFTKQFLTTVFNLTNNIFFKTENEILPLDKRPNPERIIHNDLLCTQEDFRGKPCSVNYQQFCPLSSLKEVIWNVANSFPAANYFFPLLGDAWFIAPFSALWEWHRFNFFLCKLLLTLTLDHFREFEDLWKAGRERLKTEWLWICERDASFGLISTFVPTHLKS